MWLCNLQWTAIPAKHAAGVRLGGGGGGGLDFFTLN